jgi:hypothetical protein
MTETYDLEEITIDECSLVDIPANKHARGKFAKAAKTRPQTREQALQRAADRECRQMMAKSDGGISEFAAYQKRLFEGDVGPQSIGGPPLRAAHNPAYEELMAKAERMHADGHAATVEQAFSKLYQSRDPAIRLLTKAAVMPAPNPSSSRDLDTDDDEDMADAGDDDMDDDDSGPSLGPNPAGGGGASLINRGRSSAVYEMSGVNTATNARMASVGATEGSYNPRARPASATKSKVGKRSKRFIKKFPTATVEEALFYGAAPTKEMRKALARKKKVAETC